MKGGANRLPGERDAKPGRRRKLSPDQERRLAAMWASRITGTQICQVFGISRWTLTEYRQRLGLPRRSQHQNPKEYLPATEFEKRLEQMRAGYDRYQERRLQQRQLYETDALGERVSLPPGVKYFACPGCGHRAANRQGHAQCAGTSDISGKEAA